MENQNFPNSKSKQEEEKLLQDLSLPNGIAQTQQQFLPAILQNKSREGKYFLHILLTISALIVAVFFSSTCFFNFSSKALTETITKAADQEYLPTRSITNLAEAHPNLNIVKQAFRKIFWIVIKVEFERLPLYEYLQIMNQKRYAESSDYEVRIVDPMSIYDWIPQDKARTISEIKMKGSVSINMIILLRLVVLLQHGGISVFGSNYIFIDKLNWLDQLFEKDQSLQSVLFFRNVDSMRVYEDQIIVSKKNSALIRTVLSSLLQYVRKGLWEYESEQRFGGYNNKSEVFMLQNPFSNLVTFLSNFRYSEEQFDQTLRVISLNKQNGIIKNQQKIQEMLNEKNEFLAIYPNISILELPLTIFKNQIFQILSKQNEGNIHKNSIFLQDIIKLPGNEWLWKGVNTVRKVDFCIISLKAFPINYQKQLVSSLEKLKKQHFHNWKAVYFVEDLYEQKKIYSQFPLITLARTSQYQGLNLQRAATKYCEHHDIAFLLDYDEFLGEQKSLQKMASTMTATKFYAGSLTIKTQDKTQEPQVLKFTPRKIGKPNRQYISQLSNNLRIFSISTYKLVPRGQLLDFVDGRFYDKELALLTMLEMGRNFNQCLNNQYSYQLKKKQYEGHSFPQQIAPSINTWIISPSLKQINFKLQEYNSKFSVDSICQKYQMHKSKHQLDHYPILKNFLYNNGKQFGSTDDRKNLPQKIPKIIHQIRMAQEPIPKITQILSRRLKINHKDYKYYQWTRENITRDNFPITFDILQNIIKHPFQDKKQDKNILLSDLMRLEILHSNGGFFIDNNYYTFNKSALDIFLTYKFVFPSYLIPHNRQFRENSFIGAEKGCKNIKSLLDHRLLSSRNIFDKDVRIPFGPLYFALAVTPEQQYDEDIIQPPYQFIYPYSPQYSDDDRNQCQIDKKNQTTEVLLSGKFSYSKDCPQKYYWAFGIKLYKEDSSIYQI